jgi:proteasome lid subunit RPN8/RPN11
MRGSSSSCYQLRNLSATPEKNYFASPEDLFRTMRQMRAAGEQLIAIYHSHPAGAAVSLTNRLDLAYYPEVAHLVVSLVPEVEIRAFMIRNRIVEAVAIEASEE